MSKLKGSLTQGVVVEKEVQFTLTELSRVCGTGADQLLALVEEGVLSPSGDRPDNWRFEGTALLRARAALRLARDLQLNAAGTALVLDLLDQIDELKSRLLRLGSH